MKGKKGRFEAILNIILLKLPIQPKKNTYTFGVKPKRLPLSEKEIFHGKFKLTEIYCLASLTAFKVHS
jgi:hypothetical protein